MNLIPIDITPLRYVTENPDVVVSNDQSGPINQLPDGGPETPDAVQTGSFKGNSSFAFRPTFVIR